MKIIVDNSVTVTDVDNLRELEVRSDLPVATVSQRLQAAGLGTAEGEHAWLDTHSLETMASALSDDNEWTTGYARMLDYARSKGWCDDESHTVRAHLSPLSPATATTPDQAQRDS